MNGLVHGNDKSLDISRRRWLQTGLGLCLGALSANRARAQSALARRDLTLMLDFVEAGRYAPWYVALGKGYYEKAGLNVHIVPGQGNLQPIPALEGGVVQFALTQVNTLIEARLNKNSTATFIGMIYQKPPFAVYTLDPGANVTRPQQLEGLEIATGATSAAPPVIRGFMRDHGLNPNLVRFTNVNGSARLGLFLTGKIPGMETYTMAEPVMARSTPPDEKLRMLALSDFGLDIYVTGLAARQEFLAANEDTVKAFVEASLQGWRDAFADPENAADIMLTQVKGLTRRSILDEIAATRDLVVNQQSKTRGFMFVDPGKFQGTIDFMMRSDILPKEPLKATDFYTAQFLPSPPIVPY